MKPEAVNVFISRGTPCNAGQEEFLNKVYDILREYDINPCIVGNTHYADKNPLDYVKELMHDCYGAIIIALERVYLTTGQEKRGGPNEHKLHKEIFPTVWNHIEAAIAYTLDLPILVIIEEGSRQEGLLEECFGWRVLPVSVNNEGLNSREFREVLKNWSARIHEIKNNNEQINARKIDEDKLKWELEQNPGEWPISKYLQALRPWQIWCIIGVILTILTIGFYIGDFYAKYSIYTKNQTQIQNTEHQQIPKQIETEKLLDTHKE